MFFSVPKCEFRIAFTHPILVLMNINPLHPRWSNLSGQINGAIWFLQSFLLVGPQIFIDVLAILATCTLCFRPLVVNSAHRFAFYNMIPARGPQTSFFSQLEYPGKSRQVGGDGKS